MYYFAMAATVAMLTMSVDGCKSSNSIYPQTRVVTEPAKIDFGFVGTWRADANQDDSDFDISKDVSISMGDDGVYKVDCRGLSDFTITLRAVELEENSSFAIVDVDVVADEKHFCRYLLLANRKDDELFIRWVESENIAAKLHESGHSGVIEHGTFTTRVHAKPADLIDSIRKHSEDLVGEPGRLKLVIK